MVAMLGNIYGINSLSHNIIDLNLSCSLLCHTIRHNQAKGKQKKRKRQRRGVGKCLAINFDIGKTKVEEEEEVKAKNRRKFCALNTKAQLVVFAGL